MRSGERSLRGLPWLTARVYSELMPRVTLQVSHSKCHTAVLLPRVCSALEYEFSHAERPAVRRVYEVRRGRTPRAPVCLLHTHRDTRTHVAHTWHPERFMCTDHSAQREARSFHLPPSPFSGRADHGADASDRSRHAVDARGLARRACDSSDMTTIHPNSDTAFIHVMAGDLRRTCML